MTDDMAEDWKGLFLTSVTSRSHMRVHHGQQSYDSQRNSESSPMFYTLDPELPGLEATTLFNMSTLPLDG